LRDARRIFAVSSFTRDRVIELGASADRVCVIPNGVELDSEAQSELREYGGQRILVTVSRLVPRKGHDLVLRALPRVIERFPEVKYRIVGDGPERVRLERLAQQLRIGNCVEFLGRVTETEKHQILKACEVFIMPCRETETDFEGFGISLLEAMSYGKPVIAGRSGGIPDVITDGETGLLIDPTDVDELADRIIFTLENHTDADRLGLTALQRVRKEFTWESVSHRYLSAMTSGEA
jgi:phosphatidylinositol alpha-1,6-mannosyltransferase